MYDEGFRFLKLKPFALRDLCFQFFILKAIYQCSYDVYFPPTEAIYQCTYGVVSINL